LFLIDEAKADALLQRIGAGITLKDRMSELKERPHPNPLWLEPYLRQGNDNNNKSKL